MSTKFVIFVIIISCSCGRRTTNEINNADSLIEIDLLSKPESTVKNLSDIAESINYIPLQTTEKSLIGPTILKILNIDSKFYIQKGGLEGEILCFDIDGKFLFNINKTGRGPEEYDFITDYDINSDNSVLTILSSTNKKLLTYEVTDNGFIFQRSIRLKEPVPWRVSLVPGTDKAFLTIPTWLGNEPTLSLLINAFGDTIEFKPNCYKYNKNQNKKASRSVVGLLAYTIGNMVCFKEEFSDTVFFVDAKNGSFRPRIIFDTHGTLFTPEMKGGSEKIENNSTTYLPNIFETSKYVFYWYYTTIVEQRTVDLYGFIFDKQTFTKYKFDVGKDRKIMLIDDLSGGPDFSIDFRDNRCSNGKLFSFVEAITFKKYVDSENFKYSKALDPQKKSELKRIADSLEMTDNPVLIVVTMKD
jgi:hypothetical protein